MTQSFSTAPYKMTPENCKCYMEGYTLWILPNKLADRYAIETTLTNQLPGVWITHDMRERRATARAEMDGQIEMPERIKEKLHSISQSN